MILALVLLLLAGTAEAQVIGGGVSHPAVKRCDYFASPTGLAANAGTTPSAPIRIQDFWGKSPAGKSLCLLDGTYQGSAQVISPSTQGAAVNLSGTAAGADIANGICPNCITIRALNEGRVLIDAQFARSAVLLTGNSYFLIEGINAKNGGPNGETVRVINNSNNNIFRRIVAWDAQIDKNITVWGVHNTNGPNLFEDIAGFGTSRKAWSPSQAGNNNIVRRAWFRWEGSTAGGPQSAELHYKSFGNTYENILVAYDRMSQPQTYIEAGGASVTNYGAAAPGSGAFTTARAKELGESGTSCSNSSLTSALVYVKATSDSGVIANHYVLGGSGSAVTGAAVMSTKDSSCITLRHVYSILSPSFASRNSYVALSLDNTNIDGDPVFSVSASNITTVRGTRANVIGSQWSITGLSDGTTVGAVPSAWTATTTGANLCKRWVNGVVTDEPLWPWPMNQRIKEATAAAGAYSGPCTTSCVGGRFARVAVDVTADVEALLGTIPRECRKP